MQHGVDSSNILRKPVTNLVQTFKLRQNAMGLCLAARRPLLCGELLAALPRANLLVGEAALANCLPSLSLLVSADQTVIDEEAISEEALFAARVAMEKLMGDGSHWAPYMDILPMAHVDLPRHWDPIFLRQHFRGSMFPEFVRFRTREVRREYERLVWSSHASAKLTWEQFSWAWDICSTRAASLNLKEGEPPNAVLFPLIDLASHSDSPNIECFFDLEANALCCEAVRSIDVGEEILNSYFVPGMTSWEALERWGFTSPSLERKVVSLRVTPEGIRAAMCAAAGRLDATDLKCDAFDVAGDAPHGPTSAAVAIFELANSAEATQGPKFSAYLQRVTAQSFAADDGIETLWPRGAAHKVGGLLLERALRRYPGSLEADNDLISVVGFAPISEPRAYFACILRRDEKEVLHWWIKHLASAPFMVVTRVQTPPENSFSASAIAGCVLATLLGALAHSSIRARRSERPCDPASDIRA